MHENGEIQNYKTDSLSLLTDHPKKTEIAAYRVKLKTGRYFRLS